MHLLKIYFYQLFNLSPANFPGHRVRFQYFLFNRIFKNFILHIHRSKNFRFLTILLNNIKLKNKKSYKSVF